MGEFNIMSVREMIDRTFGGPKENTVDFNLLKAIMFILASQLNILQRHVALVQTKRRKALGLTMSVTELKIHTKKRKGSKGNDYQDSLDDLKPESKKPKFILEQESLKGEKPLNVRDLKSQARGGIALTSKFTTEDQTQLDNLHDDQKASSGRKTMSRDMNENEESKSSKEIPGEIKIGGKSPTAQSIPVKSTTTDKASTDKSARDKSTKDKSTADKSSPDKSELFSRDKSTADKYATDKSTADKYATDKSTADKYATDKSSGKSADKKITPKSAADGHTSFDDLTKDQESKTPTKSPGDKTSTDERRIDHKNEDEGSKGIDKSGGLTLSRKSPTSKFAPEDEDRLNDQNKDQESKTTSKFPGGKTLLGKYPTSKFSSEDKEHLDDLNKDQKSDTTGKSPAGKTSGNSPTAKFATEDEARLNDQNKYQESKTTSKSPGGLTSSGKSLTSKFSTIDEERSNGQNKDQESKTTSKSPGGKTAFGKSPTSKFSSEDEKHLDDLNKDRESETTGKSPAGKTSSGKSPTAKSPSDKSTTIGTTPTDKSSITKSTTEKYSNKSYSEKSATNDQSTTEKTSTPKSTTEKTSSSKSTTEITSTSKSTSDNYSTSDETTEKSTKKSFSPKSLKRKSSDDDITSKSKKKTSEKSSSGSGSTEKKDGAKARKDKKTKKKGYSGDNDEDEEDDDDDSTMEILHEKLLLVSRQSSGTISSDGTLPTQEQYRELAKQVRKLQIVFGQSDKFGLLNNLHKTKSMTDPMAAINMATRLDVVEKQLAEMISTVTKAGKKLESFDDTILKQAVLKDWDAPGLSSQHPQDGQNLGALKTPPKRRGKKVEKHDRELAFDIDSYQYTDSESESGPLVQIPSAGDIKLADRTEFRRITTKIRDTMIKNADDKLKQSVLKSDDTYEKFKALDQQINAAMDMGDAFSLLECNVDSYTHKINTIDGYLSSQVTLYQDTLATMQLDLETGIDGLNEALARPNEDCAAVFAELNAYFDSFPLDLDHMLHRQQILKDTQNSYALDLEALLNNVEELRKQKSTRDELNDALSDKVDIGELNGMVGKNQFDAVIGDIEKQIWLTYELFNNKELDWQKAIDELIRSLNEKADMNGLLTLQNEIHYYLELMKYDLDEMLAIVGDARHCPTKRKLSRDGKCLSCGKNVNIEVNAKVMEWYISQTILVAPEPIVPKKAKEGESSICIPGRPIKNRIDPRSLICRTFCGAESPVPLDSFVMAEWKPSQPTTEVADSKVQRPEYLKKPCKACNSSKYRP